MYFVHLQKYCSLVPRCFLASLIDSGEVTRLTQESNSSRVIFKTHRSQGGLDNSQSHSANVFRVDDPRSESRVLHELTEKKMVEDSESDIAIRFVDEND